MSGGPAAPRAGLPALRRRALLQALGGGLLGGVAITLAARGAWAQDGFEERYKAAHSLFERMVYMEQRFDTGMKDLYADDAVIVITEIRGNNRRRTQMSGVELKKLLMSYLPTAAMNGVWYEYSNVTLTAEGDSRMRLLASRTQHGTSKSFPYQLLMGPGPHGWLIYEEQSIVEP